MSQRPTHPSLGLKSINTCQRRRMRRQNLQSMINTREEEHWATFIVCIYRNKGLEPHKRQVKLERDGKVLNVNEGRCEYSPD